VSFRHPQQGPEVEREANRHGGLLPCPFERQVRIFSSPIAQ
jgi:hypothetical protein